MPTVDNGVNIEDLIAKGAERMTLADVRRIPRPLHRKAREYRKALIQLVKEGRMEAWRYDDQIYWRAITKPKD